MKVFKDKSHSNRDLKMNGISSIKVCITIQCIKWLGKSGFGPNIQNKIIFTLLHILGVNQIHGAVNFIYFTLSLS